MPDSPNLHSGDVLTLKVISNGQPTPDTVQIVSVMVSNAANRIPSAQIVILDGEMPRQIFPVSDGALFAPGAAIKIQAGYDQEVDTIFEGIVISHTVRITGDNYSRLVVECRDKSVAMTIGRGNYNYVNMTDSQIMSNIVQRCSGVSATVESTSTTWKELVQHYCTDWDYLLARAEVNGYLVIVDQNKVKIGPPMTSSSPVLKVAWGESLMEFHGEVDSRTQLSQVTSVTWDPSKQAIVEQTAKPAGLNKQGNLTSEQLATVAGTQKTRLQTPAPIEAAALKKWAEGQQVKAGLARIRGRMTFQGNAKAKPGVLIELTGVGERFNGSLFVSAVNHKLIDGNWLSEVEFGMPSPWFTERRDIAAPPAAGYTPGIEGLHIGVVKKLDEDPEGQSRIQVSIPLLAAESDGVWARLAHYYASDGFGRFFIPEIGDEVVLGYLNNDPSCPVILGSLYSSKLQPPYPVTAENYTKALVTRSKLRVIFDDEKKIVTIITPNQNKIVVSDDEKSILLQDQNNNKVNLSPSGILIDSPKDIVINAKGKITASAVGEVSISSVADVKVSGLNISNSAQVKFAAQGNAAAELTASGQTTVRGALVMIN